MKHKKILLPLMLIALIVAALLAYNPLATTLQPTPTPTR